MGFYTLQQHLQIHYKIECTGPTPEYNTNADLHNPTLDSFVSLKIWVAISSSFASDIRAFFFFNFVICSQTGDHSQEDLTKYAYRPDMNVGKFKESFYSFSYLLKTCCRNLAINLFIFSNLDFFFKLKKPLGKQLKSLVSLNVSKLDFFM
jgi:hypothetical protein